MNDEIFHRYVNLSYFIRIKIFQLQLILKNKVTWFLHWSFWFELSFTVCPFYEMLWRSKKVSHGDFGKGPEDDNFILNDE